MPFSKGIQGAFGSLQNIHIFAVMTNPHTMNTALKFDRTSIKSLRPVSTAKEREDLWGRAMKLYEEGKFTESILAVIDYANPVIRNKFGNPAQNQFQIAHGSAIVNITLENNLFKVHTPFL